MTAAGKTARTWLLKDMPTCCGQRVGYMIMRIVRVYSRSTHQIKLCNRKLTSKATSPSNQPKCPLPDMARTADLLTLSVSVAHMQAKNT